MQKQSFAELPFSDRARWITTDVRHSRPNRNLCCRIRRSVTTRCHQLGLHPGGITVDPKDESKFEDRLVSIRSRKGQPEAVLLPGVSGSDLIKQLETEFSASSYPLRGIRCTFDGQTLTLSGTTTRYHFVQIAIGAARRLCQHGSIDCQIQVVPSPME